MLLANMLKMFYFHRKLRNLPHMAQMREILFNDNGDIAGLSMTK